MLSKSIIGAILAVVSVSPAVVQASGAKAYSNVIGTGVASETSSNPFYGKLAASAPFTFLAGFPVVRLTVNGHHDEIFILDSGAWRTTLSTEEASRLGASIVETDRGRIVGTGDSGSVPIRWATHVKLSLGKEVLLIGEVPTLSFASLNDATGSRIAGIIGYDVLRTNPTVIDYEHHSFSIFNPRRFVVSGDSKTTAFSIDKTSPLPIVEVSIAVGDRDCGSARALLDSGNGNPMVVSTSFGDLHGLRDLPGWEKGKGQGFGGEFSVLSGLPGSVSLGDHKILIKHVAVSTAINGVAGGNFYDALLGSPIFAGTSIIFDVQHGRLYWIGSKLSLAPTE